MKTKKGSIGLLAGIGIGLLLYALPIGGLGEEGKRCLALTIATVVMWALQVAHPGFISGIYLAFLCLFRVAEPSVVFSAWTGSTLWLVIGAYLIASAVKNSGLGERLSYAFILRFVKGYSSMIVSVFVLTLVLSLLVPNPWPRAFLIMTVMKVVIRAAHIPEKEATAIGFCVFSAEVPVSLIFLTGDASINPLAAAYVDGGLSFARWFIVMGIPAVLLSLLTMALFFLLFRPSVPVNIDHAEIRAAQSQAGAMNEKEKRTLCWVILAVILWMTNGLTGLDIGWVTFIIGMCMSLPLIGEVLTPADWQQVPLHVLVFLTAAIAIGRVGSVTGLNTWIAETLLPAQMPSQPLLIALLICVLSIVIHMMMGSVIAVMGITIPAFLTMAGTLGIPEVAVTGIVYLSVAGHYILPFHHLNLLVGLGSDGGGYTQKETIRMGIPLIAAILVTVCFAVLWWQIIGVI